MRLERESPAAFRLSGGVISLTPATVDELRVAVAESPLGRVRINVHPTDDDALHEMFIALAHGTYVQPHKHIAKSEAFHIVRGQLDVLVFSDDGVVEEIVPLCAADAGASDRPFYYRMSVPRFHTIRVRSELAIVHEITNGPFTPEGTIYADFAPAPSDAAAAAHYCTMLDALPGVNPVVTSP